MTHSLVVLAISDDVNLMGNKKEGSAQQKHVKLFCKFVIAVINLSRSGIDCFCNACFISCFHVYGDNFTIRMCNPCLIVGFVAGVKVELLLQWIPA